jgi:dipeptidyl aminopeptidase/acylaminoacyl peptidase
MPTKTLRTAVAALLLPTAFAGTSCGQPRLDGRILYWNSSQLFIGDIGRDSQDLQLLKPPVPLSNIIAVSAAAGRLAVVAREGAQRETSVLVLDMPSGSLRTAVRHQAYTVALAPQGGVMAFTSYAGSEGSDDLADIIIRDSTSGADVFTLRGKASPGTVLAWHPDGERIAFDVQKAHRRDQRPGSAVVKRSYRSWIEVVDIRKKQVTRLFEGSAPSWSPDGARLAYRRGAGIFIHDLTAPGKDRLVSRRKETMEGPLYWRPHSDHLLANAVAGLVSKRLKCLLIQSSSGSVRSLGTSDKWCGPWL